MPTSNLPTRIEKFTNAAIVSSGIVSGGCTAYAIFKQIADKIQSDHSSTKSIKDSIASLDFSTFDANALDTLRRALASHHNFSSFASSGLVGADQFTHAPSLLSDLYSAMYDHLIGS